MRVVGGRAGSRTVGLVAPLREIMQTSALVYLDAAVACLVWSLVAAFAGVAQGRGGGGCEAEEEEEGGKEVGHGE